MLVDHESSSSFGDGSHREVHLIATVATQRSQHLAGEALRMNANQRRSSFSQIAEHKRERCLDTFRGFSLESERLKVAPPRRYPSRGNSAKHRCWSRSRHAAGAFAVLKFGGRFSINAVSTSFTSAERTREENSSVSAFIDCSSCSRDEPLKSFLVARSAPIGLAANFSAVCVAVSDSSASGTTRVTSPIAAASSALNGWPNMNNSAARMYPKRAGNDQLEPNSGTSPRLTKGNWNFALSPAKTKSQCVSRVVPPPTAAPFTTAITGLSRLSSAFPRVACGLSPAFGGFCRKSCTSLPAENESPAASQITTRISSSFAASLSASASAMYIAEVIAFFFSGRFTVTRKMLPFVSVKISFIAHLLLLLCVHLRHHSRQSHQPVSNQNPALAGCPDYVRQVRARALPTPW